MQTDDSFNQAHEIQLIHSQHANWMRKQGRALSRRRLQNVAWLTNISAR